MYSSSRAKKRGEEEEEEEEEEKKEKRRDDFTSNRITPLGVASGGATAPMATSQKSFTIFFFSFLFDYFPFKFQNGREYNIFSSPYQKEEKVSIPECPLLFFLPDRCHLDSSVHLNSELYALPDPPVHLLNRKRASSRLNFRGRR